MEEIDITKTRSTLNWYQIGTLIGAVATTVWILAGIYFRFEQVELELEVIRDRIEYVNTRIDKKAAQNKELIEKHHKK